MFSRLGHALANDWQTIPPKSLRYNPLNPICLEQPARETGCKSHLRDGVPTGGHGDDEGVPPPRPQLRGHLALRHALRPPDAVAHLQPHPLRGEFRNPSAVNSAPPRRRISHPLNCEPHPLRCEFHALRCEFHPLGCEFRTRRRTPSAKDFAPPRPSISHPLSCEFRPLVCESDPLGDEFRTCRLTPSAWMATANPRPSAVCAPNSAAGAVSGLLARSSASPFGGGGSGKDSTCNDPTVGGKTIRVKLLKLLNTFYRN
eukprot:6413948-Pyramimonas_sp.AAC.1